MTKGSTLEKSGKDADKNAGKKKSEDCDKAAPTIEIAKPKVVLVKQAYMDDAKFDIKPHRLKIKLGVKCEWDGKGELTCSEAAAVKIFDAAEDGTELPLPVEVKNADLTGGHTVWVEGAAASGGLESTEFTLTLKDGSKPKEAAPAKDKLTCVKLKLSICKLRPDDGSDPQPMADDKKRDPGRLIHLQSKSQHADRALVIVHKAEPHAYKGKLVVKRLGKGLRVYPDTMETPKKGQRALSKVPAMANNDIDAKGKKFWVQGQKLSSKMGDSGVSLELEEVRRKEGDRVTATVCSVVLDLYRQRMKDGVDPDKFSDKDKLKNGRYLHVQDTDLTHGRALLVVRKAKPDGVEGKLVLTAWHVDPSAKPIVGAKAATPRVKLFAAAEEIPASGQSTLAYPHEFDHGSTYPADGTKFWVEGAAESDDLRDTQIRVGIKEAESGCDRVAYGVLKIEYVRPTAEFATPSSDYNNDQFKQFVNIVSNKSGTQVKASKAGRKIEIKAKLTKPFKGIQLHFMAAPDKDNHRVANNGIDIPAGWKNHKPTEWKKLLHKDDKHKLRTKTEADPAFKLHASDQTDKDGVAKRTLTLSNIGGDVYYGGVYLLEDPHLGKFEHGHATKGKRKPARTKKIHVFRKLWYQRTFANGFAVPMPTAAEACYTKVKTDLIYSNDVRFDPADAPKRTYYPEYMFKVGGGNTDVAVIGSHNKSKFFKKVTKEATRPLKAHLVICEYQYDEGKKTGLVTQDIVGFAANRDTVWIDMGEDICNPPLQGGKLVATGKWSATVGGRAKKGSFKDADIVIDNTRTKNAQVKVRFPASVPTPTAAQKVKIQLRLQYASGPWLGESDGRKIMCVYDSADVPDFNDTVAHEIGHSINQTPWKGKQPKAAPDHPNVYKKNGPHCNKGNKKCVMFHEGPQATAIHEYCEVCHPYLLIENLARFM